MDDHQHQVEVRGPAAIALSTTLYITVFTLQSLLVFSRFKTKFFLRANGILILLAMVPTTFYFVATLMTNDDFRWRRHMTDIPSELLREGLKMVLAAETMFVLACTLAKLSIMFVVRREMSCASDFWRGLVVFAIGMVSTQGLISSILVIFQCGSPSSFVHAERFICAENAGKILGSSVVNTLTDFLVMFLTIPCVLSYRLARKQKVIMYMIYSVGIASSGAGILRTYFLYQTSRQNDVTWSYYSVWITSAIQLYLGMICATLPSAKHFFSTYAPSLFGSLSFIDHDVVSQHHPSIYGGANSSGEEELLDYEKNVSGTTLGKVLGVDKSHGTVTIETRGAQGLSDEDREFIKITQQTVVQVSRIGQV